MSLDHDKRPSETPVVRASRAKFGKTLLGGFQVIYLCPKCKQELTTKNNAVMAGDTCPHCNAAFVFDEQIKQAFAALLAEKVSREESKRAEQAEKERIREEKKQEQERLASESEELHQQEVEQAMIHVDVSKQDSAEEFRATKSGKSQNTDRLVQYAKWLRSFAWANVVVSLLAILPMLVVTGKLLGPSDRCPPYAYELLGTWLGIFGTCGQLAIGGFVVSELIKLSIRTAQAVEDTAGVLQKTVNSRKSASIT
jgi:hypothetical protein